MYTCETVYAQGDKKIPITYRLLMEKFQIVECTCVALNVIKLISHSHACFFKTKYEQNYYFLYRVLEKLSGTLRNTAGYI